MITYIFCISFYDPVANNRDDLRAYYNSKNKKKMAKDVDKIGNMSYRTLRWDSTEATQVIMSHAMSAIVIACVACEKTMRRCCRLPKNCLSGIPALVTTETV